MSMSKEKLMRLAERALKRTTAYQENRELEIPPEDNYQIDYVLVKGSRSAPENVIAYASYEDSMLLLHPMSEKASAETLWDWSFNFDDDLFEHLEDGYELAGISMYCHCSVWGVIEDWHNGDLEHTAGMQQYLHYCKKHGITKELLAQEAGYDGMDVMRLYDKQAVKKAQEKPRNRER